MSNRKAAKRGTDARGARPSGDGKGARVSLRPDFRLLAIGVLIGLLVSAFLILLLLEEPGAPPGRGRSEPGGVSTVEKTVAPRAESQTQTPTAPLPGPSEVRDWVRSTALEFVGGVDSEGMPLYRFELWLDAPEAARGRIRSVSYEYPAPSAEPREQSSDDAQSGFRVRFAAATCAEEATLTLVMDDGREQTVDFNGCRVLN